jgi:hypothetical protein
MNIVRHTLLLTLLPSFLLLGNSECPLEVYPCKDLSIPCEIQYKTSGLKLSFDYLYWRTCKDNLNYAARILVKDDKISDLSLKRIGDTWHAGYRATLGYSPCETYTALVRYTNYQNDAKATTCPSEKPLVHIAPTRPPFAKDCLQGCLEPIKAHYTLDLQLLDLELGSHTSPYGACSFSIQPYGLLRIASIKQSISSSYREVNASAHYIKEKNNLEGYGALAGAKALFRAFCCMDFFGRVALGGFYGTSKLHLEETVFDQKTAALNNPYHIKAKLCSPFFTTEVAGGIRIELYELFNSLLSLEVGYELNGFFDMQDFLSFIENGQIVQFSHSKSNLRFDGAFMRLAATF